MARSTSDFLALNLASFFIFAKFFVQAHIYDHYTYPNLQNYYPQIYTPSQQGFGTGGFNTFGNNFGNNLANPNNFYQTSPHPPIPSLLSTFQLPRQVRIPGRIEININGNVAEILCEFPRYLILIQKLYWHHRYEDPYGTYYDTNQNFAPRIQIRNEGKHKSILRIVGFNEDDFGHWRCLSSAILPEDMEYYHGPGFGQGYGNYGVNPNSPINFANSGLSSGRRRKRSYYGGGGGSSTISPIKSVFAPFYRPSYGLFGIFVETKFGGGQGGPQQLQQIQQQGGGSGGSQQIRLGNNSNITNNNAV